MADSSDSGGFEGFAIGNPVGQSGWTAHDVGGYNAANFDLGIADPSGVWTGGELGSRALRISNAVTSGGFGNQLQTPSLADEVGETEAVNNGNSGGTRQSRFSATLTFASATKTYQPNLLVSLAADNGPGTRMMAFYIRDLPDGLEVTAGILDESLPGFTYPVLATGLSRTEVHTLEFTIDFVDGVNNDVFWTSLGGECNTWAQSGSWEQYHRNWAGNSPPITHTVDSILFRVYGTPAPALAGGGLFFDQVTFASSTVPPMPPAGTPGTPGAPTATANGTNVTVTSGAVATNACHPVSEYTATLTPQGGGDPIVLTGPSPTFTFEGLPPGVYDVTVIAGNDLGSSDASATSSVTVAAPVDGPGDPVPSPNPGVADPDPVEDPDATGDPDDPDELADSGPANRAAGWTALTLLAGGALMLTFARRQRA